MTTLFLFDDSQDRDEANEAPEAMINLEIWIPQGYNLLQEVDSRNLEDCGALGPTGRYFHFLRRLLFVVCHGERRTFPLIAFLD